MRKKITTVMLGIICIILIVVSVDIFSDKIIVHKKYNETPAIIDEDRVPETIGNNESSSDKENEYPIYNIGGILYYDDSNNVEEKTIEVTMKDCYFSKEVPDIVENTNDIDITWTGYDIIDRTISKDGIFFIMVADVKNINKEDIEVNFGGFRVDFADESGTVVTYSELLYSQCRLEPVSRKEGFTYLYKAGETEEVLLLFPCGEDEYNRYQPYLTANFSGAVWDDGNKVHIKVEK